MLSLITLSDSRLLRLEYRMRLVRFRWIDKPLVFNNLFIYLLLDRLIWPAIKHIGSQHDLMSFILPCRTEEKLIAINSYAHLRFRSNRNYEQNYSIHFNYFFFDRMLLLIKLLEHNNDDINQTCSGWNCPIGSCRNPIPRINLQLPTNSYQIR